MDHEHAVDVGPRREPGEEALVLEAMIADVDVDRPRRHRAPRRADAIARPRQQPAPPGGRAGARARFDAQRRDRSGRGFEPRPKRLRRRGFGLRPHLLRGAGEPLRPAAADPARRPGPVAHGFGALGQGEEMRGEGEVDAVDAGAGLGAQARDQVAHVVDDGPRPRRRPIRRPGRAAAPDSAEGKPWRSFGAGLEDLGDRIGQGRSCLPYGRNRSSSHETAPDCRSANHTTPYRFVHYHSSTSGVAVPAQAWAELSGSRETQSS